MMEREEKKKKKGKEQKAAKSQVERKRKKISFLFILLVELLGKKCGRDSRTRVLNVAQFWQSRVWAHSVGAPNLVAQCNMAIYTKQKSLSKPIYPAGAHITYKLAVGFSILTGWILTSLYTGVPWGMHFKTISGMLHFLWCPGRSKTDSAPQHMRWTLQYLFNKHMISNTCPSSHTWYLLWYDKEQGRGGK